MKPLRGNELRRGRLLIVTWAQDKKRSLKAGWLRSALARLDTKN